MTDQRSIAGLSAFLLVASTALVSASAGASETLTKKVGGTEVKVVYAKDQEWWAKRVLGALEKGLPALEKAAGFPYPRPAVEIGLAEAPGAAGAADAVSKDGKIVAQRQVRGVSILFEVALGYAGAVAAEDWGRYGLAHYYVYAALADAPRIYDQWAYRDEVLSAFQSSSLSDVPLAGAKIPNAYDGTAGKAFAFFYGIARTLGGDVLTKTGADIVAAKKPAGANEIKAALEKTTGKPIAIWFKGWVEPGVYSGYKPASLADGDGDGARDHDETAMGTKPDVADTDGDGWSDGEELFGRTDAKAKDPETVVKLDGKPEEWKRLRRLQLQDRVGDAKGDVKGADLKDVKLGFDEKFMYATVELADPFTNPDVVLSFCFDGNANGVWDDVAMFRPGGKARLGQLHDNEDWSVAEWKNHRWMKVVGDGAVLELRVPLAALDLPKEFGLLVLTTAQGGNLQVDTALRDDVVSIEKFRLDKK
jgi:hypothetical protein